MIPANWSGSHWYLATLTAMGLQRRGRRNSSSISATGLFTKYSRTKRKQMPATAASPGRYIRFFLRGKGERIQ